MLTLPGRNETSATTNQPSRLVYTASKQHPSARAHLAIPATRSSLTRSTLPTEIPLCCRFASSPNASTSADCCPADSDVCVYSETTVCWQPARARKDKSMSRGALFESVGQSFFRTASNAKREKQHQQPMMATTAPTAASRQQVNGVQKYEPHKRREATTSFRLPHFQLN